MVYSLNETVSELGNLLARAFLYLGAGKTAPAVRTARKVISRSLESAGLAVLEVLGGSKPVSSSGRKTPFTTSMMVPMTRRETECFLSSSRLAKGNGTRADAIFRGVPCKEKLVVVGEALAKPQHSGFWVPLLEDDRASQLVGATQALADAAGSAVYTHDLPRLGDFDPGIGESWREHMRTKFAEAFFVSLPYAVTLKGRQKPRPIAVINVNVKPNQEEAGEARWARLTHPEWRLLAADRVARFARLAMVGYSIVEAVPQPARAGRLLWEGKGFSFRPWIHRGRKLDRKKR
jgi:hypothetical protein